MNVKLHIMTPIIDVVRCQYISNKSNKHLMVIGLVMNGHFILYRFVVIYLYGSIIIHSVVNVYFISYRFVFMTISSFINNYLLVYLSYFKIPIFSVYGKHDFKMITEKYDMVYVFSQRLLYKQIIMSTLLMWSIKILSFDTSSENNQITCHKTESFITIIGLTYCVVEISP